MLFSRPFVRHNLPQGCHVIGRFRAQISGLADQNLRTWHQSRLAKLAPPRNLDPIQFGPFQARPDPKSP